jgi:hypothetical protein
MEAKTSVFIKVYEVMASKFLERFVQEKSEESGPNAAATNMYSHEPLKSAVIKHRECIPMKQRSS